MPRSSNAAITRFIVDQIEDHPSDITALIVERFGVTRATASNYVRRLIADGMVEAEGHTRGKRYTLRRLDQANGREIITANTQDDEVWRQHLLPRVNDLPPNIVAICGYGFTEMFNNVIDHAASDACHWTYARSAKELTFSIRDYGIGIFEKIQRSCGLSDHRQALFELSKGKLTTDATKHTGEGIFFTSRAFDYFAIVSTDIFYSRRRDDDHQWLIDWQPTSERVPGTTIHMSIEMSSITKLDEVFRHYEDDDFGFSKTAVSLNLARYALDQLISRSQAKRLMVRLDGFREVMLDFEGVDLIGQAFADEIFRVFAANHPNVHIMSVNTNRQTAAMIERARNASLRTATAFEKALGDSS